MLFYNLCKIVKRLVCRNLSTRVDQSIDKTNFEYDINFIYTRNINVTIVVHENTLGLHF